MTLDQYQAEQKRKAAERKEKQLKQQEEARAAAKARAAAFERGELPAEADAPALAPTTTAKEVKKEAPEAPKEGTKVKEVKEVSKPKPQDEPEDWEAEAEKEESKEVKAKEAPPPKVEEKVEPKVEPKEKKSEAPPAPPAQAEAEPEEEEEEVKPDAGKDSDKKIPDPRPHLNVVFIGHVDAGKSTTCGNILFLCGMVDDRTIEKYKQEAAGKAGESWFLAFIMDTSEEEKVKGKTVEVGRAAFETQNRRFTILDAPGHKSYVPNMIAGASAADVGVLLISARKGEFETGFEKGGQTCEHALLAKTLGVDKLVCAVNKMDDPTVQWDEKRYNEIVKKIGAFLKKSGYKDGQVIFLPMSGLMGDNIKDRKGTPSWYQGQTLLDALDGITVSRKAEGPVRIPMMEGYKDMGAVTAIGKVEQGTVKPGMKCIVMPTYSKCTVASVFINDVDMQYATCGENVTLKMTNISDEELKKGYVLCFQNQPIPVVTKFKAQIHLIELGPDRPVMTSGYVAVMHAHTASEECEILKLYETMVIQTKKKEKNPQFARPDSVVVCSIKLARPTALDTFQSSQQLGRFTLRVDGRTIAIGKITELPKSAGENA